MNSSIGQKLVVLGNEYDDKLRERLLEVLQEMGAKPTDHWKGVGGSQELERLEVNLEAKSVVVEAETYVGLTITGDAVLVDDVARRVRARTAG